MSDSVNNLLGSLLGTFCFAILLYGSATSQAYNYWWNYPNDVKFHRRIVISVWSVVFHRLCENDLTVPYQAWEHHDVHGGCARKYRAKVEVTPFLQGYIALRRAAFISVKSGFRLILKYARESKKCTIMLGDGATMQLYNTFSGLPWTQAAMLSARIGTCVLLFKYKTLSRFAESQGPLIITVCGLSLGAAVDLMSPHPPMCSQFALQHDNFVYVGLVEVQAKLYANSLFATVTERAAIRAAAQEEEVFEANGQVPVPRSHNLPSLSQLNAAYCVLPEAWPKAQNGRAPFLYSSGAHISTLIEHVVKPSAGTISNDKLRSPDLNSRSITVHLDVRMNLVLPRTNAFGAVVCHITEDELLGDGE
ncbi:predicted protein [Postia placenta Mad-698-R]|nr:predicted protein [Postia placenta Mad-698-R]